MDRGYNFERKIAIRSKTHRKEGSAPEKNNQEEKDWNIAFRDTIPALSVYKKEALMEKWDLIQNQPLPCQNFKEPPKVLFLWGRKIMAKDIEPKHERDRCAACHPLQFFNKNNLSIQKAKVQ